MKKIIVALMAILMVSAAVLPAAVPAFAAEVETLYVCGLCSAWFIEDAQNVIADMGLEESLEVKRCSCLGACAEPAVIEFRDEVYWGMDSQKLKMLLENLVAE